LKKYWKSPVEIVPSQPKYWESTFPPCIEKLKNTASVKETMAKYNSATMGDKAGGHKCR
jgi:hypothetical protein